MRITLRIALSMSVILAGLTIVLSATAQATPVSCASGNFQFGQDLILACSSTELFKAINENKWQMIHPVSFRMEVKASPDNTIYLYEAYEIHELRRSLDAGQTWELMGTPPFANFAGNDHIFPSPVSGTLFLGTWDLPFSDSYARGVFKSLNSGLTWTKVLTGGNGRYVAVSPGFAQDGTAFAALDEYHASLGIWKTVDEGETWFPVNNGLYVGGCIPGQLWVVVSPQFPQDQTAFTSDCTGFYRTINGGQVWSKIAGAVINEAVALSPNYNNDQTLLIGNHDTGLYLSQDGGVSQKQIWSGSVFAWGVRRQAPVGTALTSPPPSATYRTYLPIVSDNANALEFWMVVPKGQPIQCYLYRSRDYGVTWEEVAVFEASHWMYLPNVYR
jgi:hypothetical protein